MKNFDGLWYTTAHLELDDSQTTKYDNNEIWTSLKFKMGDGRHLKKSFLAITQQRIVPRVAVSKYKFVRYMYF